MGLVIYLPFYSNTTKGFFDPFLLGSERLEVY